MKIDGFLDEELQPKISLVTRGRRKAAHTVFVIDTGFSGDICLPVGLAIELGLELLGRDIVEFADGTIKRELTFAGWVDWYDARREVQVMLTDSEEALIGSGMLKDQKLTIDYPSRSVTIEPANPAKR